jgi:hypothetical protein
MADCGPILLSVVVGSYVAALIPPCDIGLAMGSSGRPGFPNVTSIGEEAKYVISMSRFVGCSNGSLLLASCNRYLGALAS